MSFGQRYQIDPTPEPEPQVEAEPDPGVVMVPPIVLEAVRVPVVLEVDDASLRAVAGLIGSMIRLAVTEAITAGFQDASGLDVDDDPSSDRSG